MERLWNSFSFILVLLFGVNCNNVSYNLDEIIGRMKSDPGYGQTWMYFPDGNGVPQVAYLTDPGPKVKNVDPLFDDRTDVTYYLYRK